jgi:hypothetical protein
MSIPSPKICRTIRAMFSAIADSNKNVADRAREKLLGLLAKHGLNWSEIPACIAAADEDDRVRAGRAAQQRSQTSSGATAGPTADLLELVLYLIERHFAITPEERMAVALWILHTYVFDRYDVTPRLALLSPVRGCGKTTLLMLLEALTQDPDRADNVSAASIYYELERGLRTLLLDEGDNLGLLNNPTLRSVLNGNQRGCFVKRFIAGRTRKFPTFTPLAIAAIGMLPLPLLDRSIIINMQRAPQQMVRLDVRDPVLFAVRNEIRNWAATCKLNPDPDNPWRNRAADNWRVLLAIADDLGYGEAARAAAITLGANLPDQDPGVLLLTDIRSILDRLGIDRITSKVLIDELRALDDGMWNDWRGLNDDRPPRKLNQSDLARLLRLFNIRPQTIWPIQRRPDSRSSRGYLRAQFESAWASYCPPADTPTQPSRVIPLARAASDT